MRKRAIMHIAFRGRTEGENESNEAQGRLRIKGGG